VRAAACYGRAATMVVKVVESVVPQDCVSHGG
jgi:hypothetical protein